MTEATTCVIVDDHEAVRAGTRARLDQLPWIRVVGEAGTVGDAGAMIADLAPELVLMDMRMPGGDGGELVRSLTANGCTARIVMYSGFATTTIAEQLLEAGAYGFVLKDSPLSVVVDALQSARDGRRYLDPTIAAELMTPHGRPLSPREHEILTLMADGHQNATIAFQLSISSETVKAHVSNILAKFTADSRTGAVATAFREGLIS